ncbi:MAG: hypothetical protein QM761_07860 [Pseudoxanthomonas sp.]
MTRAADLIAALLPRKAALLLEKSTGLPHGWGVWLRGSSARQGGIGRDKSEAVVGHFVVHPPAPPAGWKASNRWQAFRALFYQGWEPPPREERGLRWFAGAISLLLHLLFALFLLVFALVGVRPPPPDDAASSRTQIEFIGQGTPEETGGGAPGEAAAPAPSPSAAAPAASPPASAAASAPSASQQAAQARPAPPPPPTAAAQPVQVSEATEAPAEFVLPEPRVRIVETPTATPRTPQLEVPTREVTVVETPSLQPTVRPREIDVPALAQPTPQLRERDIPAPVQLPQLRAPQIESRAPAEPQLRQPTAEVREREIPAPVQLPQVRTPQIEGRLSAEPGLRRADAGVREREIPAPASTSGAAAESAAASGQAPQSQGDAPASATAASPGQGNQGTTNLSGPAAGNRAGGQPSPKRGDDWGVSDRNAPGQDAGAAGRKPGLFNADGSLRVGDDLAGKTTTQPGPPGSRAQQAADADRANKWLERVEYAYEPTMFDKYWVPRESLLEEWVRKGIKSVEVSIPGTGKKVRCVVSMLQLGGGCGLFDPNLNDQPATARPPPEIPVKRNPVPEGS